MNDMPQIGLGPEIRRMQEQDSLMNVSPAQFGGEPLKRALALGLASVQQIQEIMRQNTVLGVAELALWHDVERAINVYHATIIGEPPAEPIDVRNLAQRVDALSMEIEAMKMLKDSGRVAKSETVIVSGPILSASGGGGQGIVPRG